MLLSQYPELVEIAMSSAQAAAFANDWLRLRAPLDEAARAAELLSPLVAAVDSVRSDGDDPLCLLDLGAGTGANLRYLAPRLADYTMRPQHWTLVDWDDALLAQARAETESWAGARGWQVESASGGFVVSSDKGQWAVTHRVMDLARDLDRLDLGGCDAVVMSAFLDLVSPGWLAGLIEGCVAAARPILVSLTYDGGLE
jgi:trans-aconitate methyltransferase